MSNKKEVLFLREEYGNGQGTYIYPNGEKYVGDWKNGKYHGHGTFTYPDGNMYVGEFKDGLKNGQGTFTYPGGEKYEGEWKDGKPWNLTIYDKNELITGKWENGILQE